MKTKTLLIILAVVAVIVIVITLVMSKDSIKNPSDNTATPETPVVTPDEQSQVVIPTTPPTAPENPSFPTTGFEPNN